MVLAAFLASLVEFVEALTIVLAVGITRGWRSAIAGAVLAVFVLAALVAALGPGLERIPIRVLQLTIGFLLLLFGMRWLRNAILRAGGILSLHDETGIFARQRQTLQSGTPSARTLDALGFITSAKAVLLEGLEVVFIVIAVGAAGNMLLAASLGAAAAGVLVLLLGLFLHKPLSQVPENTLKFSVGVLLSAFGVFWIGEGMRFAWPGDDWAILGLVVAFLGVSLFAVHLAKNRRVVLQ